MLIKRLLTWTIHRIVFTALLSLWADTANATFAPGHQHPLMHGQHVAHSTLMNQVPISQKEDAQMDEQADGHGDSSEEQDDTVRYFEMPEGIASVTIQPTLKKVNEHKFPR